MKLFTYWFSSVPSGFITDTLYYEDYIKTPLKSMIHESDYQQFFLLKNVAYNKEFYGRKFVDVWFLAEDLTKKEL